MFLFQPPLLLQSSPHPVVRYFGVLARIQASLVSHWPLAASQLDNTREPRSKRSSCTHARQQRHLLDHIRQSLGTRAAFLHCLTADRHSKDCNKTNASPRRRRAGRQCSRASAAHAQSNAAGTSQGTCTTTNAPRARHRSRRTSIGNAIHSPSQGTHRFTTFRGRGLARHGQAVLRADLRRRRLVPRAQRPPPAGDGS